MVNRLLLVLLCTFCGHSLLSQTDTSFRQITLERAAKSFKWRFIGPAIASGRIADLAVHPNDPSTYYVGVASGGVWKTTNSGITYTPIFDNQDSYSIGVIKMAPSNPNIVWVGTGENNNQRSVAYGDGVYKSEDGGKSWSFQGLIESEHIGNIVIHPSNPDIVYVASYGPLWSPGGDRGIYKTIDGGDSWERIHSVSQHTGFNEIVMDPEDPNTLYAAAHQRRRHVFTYISGGPESALYKTTNGGETWKKLRNGLPEGDVGRIGIDVSPTHPNILYAIIEGKDIGGVYASTDYGASWEKRSDYYTSGNYYQEIKVHPTDPDIVYVTDTYGQVSRNGGRNWKRIGNKHRHVDDHAYWINPEKEGHMLVGSDGGIYETFDDGENWHFKENLPVTQFYRIAVDNDTPFYNVYGGTQDNFTLGGPSQTINQAGITNEDWFVVKGGDGFEPQVDPTDANTVYAQSQYGWLVRYDRQSGESISIKPLEGLNEPGLRWNWDAPLLLSPHDPHILYFAANKVFKSTDQGNNWSLISPDLTRQFKRDELPVMGRLWSIDAVAKHRSTSIYGNIVALNESPLQQGLIYAGTDDGLIQVTANGGENWTRYSTFSGVPDTTYVNAVLASLHEKDRVYAAFNNHKRGDFKPYLLRSDDRGRTWSNIAGNLPGRGSVYSIAEDHKDSNLLFAGTEFGVFYTNDGGSNWHELTSGLPTIAVRDLEIHRRDEDLIAGTFGRGIYIMDDYSALRMIDDDHLADNDYYIYNVEDALLFEQTTPLGYGGKGFRGETYFTTPNPGSAARVMYYIRETAPSLEMQRKKRENEMIKDGTIMKYPSLDSLRMEDDEEKNYLIFSIYDSEGYPVRRLTKPLSKGISVLNWDLRHAAHTPVNSSGSEPWDYSASSYYILPGEYTVVMGKIENGIYDDSLALETFMVKPLNLNRYSYQDEIRYAEFLSRVRKVRRLFSASSEFINKQEERIDNLRHSVRHSPGTDLKTLEQLNDLRDTVLKIKRTLYGDATLSNRGFEQPPSLYSRLNQAVWNIYYSTNAPTGTLKKQVELAEGLAKPLLQRLHELNDELTAIEDDLLKEGFPARSGRLPAIPD